MNEKKLTDEEIIKAYKCCFIDHIYCGDCPCDDWGCGVQKEDILGVVQRLQDENAELQKQVDELKGKEIPKKVKCHIKLPKDRIAGYCPTCDGTVDIKLTWLVEHKGHRCSWCGQAIDLTGVEVE